MRRLWRLVEKTSPDERESQADETSRKLSLRHKHRRILGFIRSRPDLFRGKRILDAGGREGLIIDGIEGAQWKLILDINRSELRKSSTEDKVMADLKYIPFVDDSFDVAIFSEVMEHVEEPDEVVAELARTCKDVILTTPNSTGLRRALWRVRGKEELSAPGHVKEFSPREVRSIFSDFGFRAVEHKGIGFMIEKPRFLLKLLLKIEAVPYLASKMLMHFRRTA